MNLSVVTGGTSGIGREVALCLIRTGRRVLIVGRNETEGRRLAASHPELLFHRADLSLLSEVRSLSNFILNLGVSIELLVHSAGAHAQKRERTSEGVELNLAINYCAKFALTYDLLPALQAAKQARIVVVGSPYIFDPARFLDPERLNSDPIAPPFWTLVKSGMAVSVWTAEMARRLRGSTVTINALVPGVVRTNILRDSSTLMRLMDKTLQPLLSLSVEQGAAGPLTLALSPDFAAFSGRFWKNDAKSAIGLVPIKVPRHTFDKRLAARLWAVSQNLSNAPTPPLS